MSTLNENWTSEESSNNLEMDVTRKPPILKSLAKKLPKQPRS